MKRRVIAPHEALALDPRAVRSSSKAIWWDMGTPITPNDEYETDAGCVQVVHVRGSLEHHSDYGCDSYDGLRERFTCAFEEDPIAVVARIDSPGGVVSGLNEFVYWLRRTQEKTQIPLVAYVDELAASAAYAIACGCSAIAAPKSAIVGSVGVISTLHDQVQADKRMGLRFVTIASGSRKTDGHPHVEVSDDAIAVEQARVQRLAVQFYRIVAAARPIPLAHLKSTRGFEAGIFLADKAESIGLVDQVVGWDDFLADLVLDKSGNGLTSSKRNSGQSDDAKGNETDRRAQVGDTKMLTLRAELKKYQAAATAETDPERKMALLTTVAGLQATIEAAKKITHEKHEKKTVTDDGGDSDEGDEDDSEEDEESAEKGDDDSDSDDDDDDDDDDDSEEDEEEEASYSKESDEESAKKSEEEEAKKASLSLRSTLASADQRKAVRAAVRVAVRNAIATERARTASLVSVMQAAKKVTGQRSASAIVGALDALPKQRQADAALKARVQKLEGDKRRGKIDSQLDAALKSGRITKAEVTNLRDAGMRDPRWLKGHLAARPKLVRVRGEEFVPREGTAGAGPSNEDQLAMMQAATAGMSDEERKAFEAGVAERMSKLNGHPSH